MTEDDQLMIRLGRLSTAFYALPVFQQRVLVRVAERLTLGVKRYGRTFEVNRNLKNEVREELLDAIIYSAVLAELSDDAGSTNTL